MASEKSQKSPLTRLFDRQKPKVSASPRVADVLNTYANDSHKAIAMLIAKWLDEDNSTPKK